ncbi:hypothetical protein SDC9_174622 [bioreactor metagenome]|uniref:Uncharacterized protein n=1 Tax=bioreactor metagenome TaxID=1076179 RepID=A0A645GKE7_9ZZZZ
MFPARLVCQVHEHKHRTPPAKRSVEVPYLLRSIAIQYLHQPVGRAPHNCLLGLPVYPAGIVIVGIVRKISTYNKQVAVAKPRCQCRGYFAAFLRGNLSKQHRHNRVTWFQYIIQKGKLNLNAMFTGMVQGIGRDKGRIISAQGLPGGLVHNLGTVRHIEIGSCINRSTVE